MPIKAAPVEVKPITLIRSDPTGETIFYMRPMTGRDDIIRGELLRNGAYANDDVYGVVTKVEANLPELRVEELWMLYDHAQCVVVTGEEPNQEEAEPFQERGKMTHKQFREALWTLPSSVRTELWSRTIQQCAPGWLSPF